MNAGQIEQIGSPQEVYYHPRTRFVATFLGDNNLVEGESSQPSLATALGPFPAPPELFGGYPGGQRRSVKKIRIAGQRRPDDIVVRGKVENVIFTGAITH